MTDLISSMHTDSSTPRGPSGDLSGEVIRSQKFDTSFRGYDTAQVRQFLGRVGAQVSNLNDKVLGLTIELESARSVAPVIDLTDAPAQLAQANGSVTIDDQMAAVVADAEEVRATEELLDEARREAKLIIDRAHDEAGRILFRARAESRGKPADAPIGLGDTRAESDAETPEAAREQARAMIAEARAVRERILTDLAKRRRTAHVQLEQLRVGREKLLETMREARRVVDAATGDLLHAETEARLAAEAAGRRVAEEPMPTAEQIGAELLGASLLAPPRSVAVRTAADEQTSPTGHGSVSAVSSATSSAASSDDVAGDFVDDGETPTVELRLSDMTDEHEEISHLEQTQIEPAGEAPAPTDLELAEQVAESTAAAVVDGPSDSELKAERDIEGDVEPETNGEVLTVAESVLVSESVLAAEPGLAAEPVLVDQARSEPESTGALIEELVSVESVSVESVSVEQSEPLGGVVIDATPSAEEPAEGATPITAAVPTDADGESALASSSDSVSDSVSDSAPDSSSEPSSGLPPVPPRRRSALSAFAELRAGQLTIKAPLAEPSPVTDDGGAIASPVPVKPMRAKSAKTAQTAAQKPSLELTVAPSEPSSATAIDQPVEPLVGSLDGEAPVNTSPVVVAVSAEPVGDLSVAYAERRTAELELLQLRVTRRLKRQLQDDHSAALSSVRKSRGQVSALTLLSERSVAVDRIVAALESGVDEAFEAGRRSIALMTGSAVVQHRSVTEATVRSVTTSLAERVFDDISGSVEAVLSAGGADASSVLGAAFRDWSTDRIGREVAETLAHAFGVGAVGQFAPGTDVIWVVEHGDEPSPDCDDNSLAGSVALGQTFPTGHALPPLGSGCRCFVVPAHVDVRTAD